MLSDQRLSTLVVDDDPDVVEFMTNFLRSANCNVRSATNGDQALQEADSFCPDIVFLDIDIPEQDGWLVCFKLKMRGKAPPIVLITGRTEENTDRFADLVHADGVLLKPFSGDDVQRVMEEMCSNVAKD